MYKNAELVTTSLCVMPEGMNKQSQRETFEKISTLFLRWRGCSGCSLQTWTVSPSLWPLWMNEWVIFIEFIFGVDWWEMHTSSLSCHPQKWFSLVCVQAPLFSDVVPGPWFVTMVPLGSNISQLHFQKFKRGAHSHPPFSLNVFSEVHVFCKLRFQPFK